MTKVEARDILWLILLFGICAVGSDFLEDYGYEHLALGLGWAPVVICVVLIIFFAAYGDD